MQVFFHTLGCKVNQYETEYMRKILNGVGYIDAKSPNEADLIIVNSCTVTAESDRKTRQLVRRYRRLNENAILVLCGCMPQAFPKEAEKLPIDILLGNVSRSDLLNKLDEFLAKRQKQIEVLPHKKGEDFESCHIETFSERTRAYMKIEDGCDRGCTYCIIPKARGRVRSRALESIEKEAIALSQNGFSEIVLVGINLSSYGKDIGKTLADAVAAVAKAPGVKRIRLGSLEPDLTDEPLLDRLEKIDKFCPQFHLSLQSGCDETLKRMNRLYSSEEYKKVVENIRKRWKNAGITTDIMVGFVSESEEEFEKSLSFAKEIGFVKAHVFPYSVRVGTAAEKMSGRVDEAIKNARAAKMARVCEESSQRLFKSLCGEILNVLFETEKDGYLMGYSEGYVPVYVKGERENLHKILGVKAVDTVFDGVLGEI